MIFLTYWKSLGRSGNSQIPNPLGFSRPSQNLPICQENRRFSRKSGTRRENRNAPDFTNLSPNISDDLGCLRFHVFISRQNLGRSRKSKIPDHFPTYENQVGCFGCNADFTENSQTSFPQMTSTHGRRKTSEVPEGMLAGKTLFSF